MLACTRDGLSLQPGVLGCRSRPCFLSFAFSCSRLQPGDAPDLVKSFHLQGNKSTSLLEDFASSQETAESHTNQWKEKRTCSHTSSMRTGMLVCLTTALISGLSCTAHKFDTAIQERAQGGFLNRPPHTGSRVAAKFLSRTEPQASWKPLTWLEVPESMSSPLSCTLSLFLA